jgi:hypothetical protein
LDVLANDEIADVTNMDFTPALDEFASPYTTFTFKVKDSNGNFSTSTYTMTINVLDITPTGSNEDISLYMNETYIFGTSDFTFSGMNGATFAGIKIISVETIGDLEYNSLDVLANDEIADVTNLDFTPSIDEFASPYSTFTFKVKDSNGNFSTSTYTMTINVLEVVPAIVYWLPEFPTEDDVITIYVENDNQMLTTSKLHWGVNEISNVWTTPDNAYWPTGTTLFNGIGPAVETIFTQENVDLYSIELGPFNNVIQEITSLHFVLHYSIAGWNNNGGDDWNLTILPSSINDNSGDFSIELFPNPFNDYMIIKINDKNIVNYNVTLTDLTGKILKYDIIKSQESYIFNKNKLSDGLYLMRFENSVTGAVQNSKIIIY